MTAAEQLLLVVGQSGGARPLRFVGNRTLTPATFSTVASGAEYQASANRFYTPNYAQTGYRVCIPNYYTPTSAVSPWEVALDAGRQIEGYALKIGSTFYPVTFGGSSSHTFSSEPYVWSDELLGVTLPANTAIDEILCDYTPIGSRRPKSYDPALGKYGGGYSVGSTTQSAYLTAGTVPAPVSTGVTNAGACARVARGAPSSQPVPLVIGMSITAGTATSSYNELGARANHGYVAAGFDDDTAGVGRFAFGMFAVGATTWSSISATNFAIRKALLAEIAALQGGEYPFNVIYCEHGQNTTDAGLSLVTLRANAGWAFLKTMGGKRLVHGGINPLTSDATTSLWTDPSLTTVSANNTRPTGVRWTYYDYVASLPDNVDAVVDLRASFVDATLTDRWKQIGRDSTLAADVSSGNVISVTGTPPIVGDQIVIGAGAVGAISRNVGAVSGSGPYSVTFTSGETAISTSFLTGAAVKAAATPDGIHGTGAFYGDTVSGPQSVIIAAKLAGVFSGSSKQLVPVPTVVPTDIANLVAWFEPGKGGMFQSNAGTTPAVANGDLIGLLPDSSPAGFTLTSLANDATRPILRGVGSKPYAEFTKGNSNILIRAASLGGYAAGAHTVVACLVSTAGAVNNYFGGDGDSASANSVYNIFNLLDANNTGAFIRNSAGTSLFANGTQVGNTVFPDGSTVVVYGVVDNGSTLTPYINGVPGTAVAYTRSGSLTQNRFGLGGLYRNTAGLYMSMNLYGTVRYNRALTGTEMASLFLYLDGLH